jgi:hypothetical protein
MFVIRQQPKTHYIQNELYSKYSNVNGNENYAEIEKTNNDGRIRIRKNVNGNKMEYYVLPPVTFSDNNTNHFYPLHNTSNYSKHKKHQRIRNKSKRNKYVKKTKRNKSVKNK